MAYISNATQPLRQRRYGNVTGQLLNIDRVNLPYTWIFTHSNSWHINNSDTNDNVSLQMTTASAGSLTSKARSTSAFTARVFSSSASQLWNNLPPHLTDTDDLSSAVSFKPNLKTHLYTAAFSWHHMTASNCDSVVFINWLMLPYKLRNNLIITKVNKFYFSIVEVPQDYNLHHIHSICNIQHMRYTVCKSSCSNNSWQLNFCELAYML